MHCRTDSPVLRSSSASVPSILFSAMLNGFVSLWLTQMLKCRSSRSEANFRPQLPQAERGASLAGLSSNSLLLPLGISSLVVWPYSKGSLPMGTLRETFHPSGIRHCLREIVLGGHVHMMSAKIFYFLTPSSSKYGSHKFITLPLRRVLYQDQCIQWMESYVSIPYS